MIFGRPPIEIGNQDILEFEAAGVNILKIMYGKEITIKHMLKL
jgi:hypothetical protein